MIDQSVINDIRESNNIVDVINSYVPLKKSGTSYKCLCPFHNDTNPSMMVSEKKQIFKCFVCGASGNVFSFVMDFEKISFIDAVKKLAARVGIQIESSKPKSKAASKRDLIYKIYDLTASHFKENLWKHGTSARDYLKKRSISEDTMKRFELGYALDSYSGLLNFLTKNHINRKILEESGLFHKGQKGIFDAFRDRIMFPIKSITGKTIAFGGRVIHADQKGGKYINSPTTEIYQKGKELYGLYTTKYDISKEDNVIVVEGYTDLIRLYENGVTNVCASLGTALTEEQIYLLGRYTKNIYLLYDGDIPGRKAAAKVASIIVKLGLNAKIIELPSGEDPDSFFLTYEKEQFYEIFENASNLAHFLHKDNSMNIEHRQKIDMLLNLANDMKDEISLELFAKEIAEEFGINIGTLLNKVNSKRTKRDLQKDDLKLAKDPVIKEIVKFLINNPDCFESIWHEINYDYFLLSRYGDILRLLSENIGAVDEPTALVNFAETPEMKNEITDIIIEEQSDITLDDLLNQVRIVKYQIELNSLNKKIVLNEKNDELFGELLEKKMELKKKIRLLSSKSVNKTIH